MRRRKLVITLAAAAVFGVLVVPASAELHRVTVTLVTGQTLTLTVDVPPGASVESIQIPGLPAPVQSITDLGPVATPTPADRRPHASPAAQAAAPDAALPRAAVATAAPGRRDDHARARNQTSGSTGVRAARRPASTVPLEPNTEALTGALEDQGARARRRSGRPATRRATPTARRRSTTRRSRSPRRARPVSASRTSSSRSSASRPSCSRSTRPPGSSTACAGRSSPRSTRSRPTTAATSTSPPRARSAGCSSCPPPGTRTASTATTTASRTRTTRSTRSSPPRATCRDAGADTDLRAAIFAYNHADWYVDSVILRARYIGGLPADLVGSLSGLTQGRFPVQAKASYAKDVTRRTQGRGRAEPRLRGRVQLPPQRHQDLHQPRRAGRGRQRRPHRQDRPQPQARQLRGAAGRLRQHVHVRAPQGRRRVLPDAQAARDRRAGRSRAS